MLTINGTSVALINKWIAAMESDIKENKFYLVTEEHKIIYVSSLNIARLFVMNKILPQGCQSDGEDGPFTGKLIKHFIEGTKEDLSKYLETLKSFIN
jgi:hypothetical protein